MANKILPSIAPKPTVFPPTTGCDNCENLTARIEQAENDIEELQGQITTADDHKWNDVELSHGTNSELSGHVPIMGSLSATTANLKAATTNTGSRTIVVRDSQGFVHSTTPHIYDAPSDVTATTQYVMDSLDALEFVKDIQMSENNASDPFSLLDNFKTFTFGKVPVEVGPINPQRDVLQRNRSFIFKPFDVLVISLQITLGRGTAVGANVPYPVVTLFDVPQLQSTRAVSATRNVATGAGSLFSGMVSPNGDGTLTLFVTPNIAITTNNEYTIDFDQVIFLEGESSYHTLHIDYVGMDGEVFSSYEVNCPTGEVYFVDSPDRSGEKSSVPVVSGIMPDSDVTLTIQYEESD